MNRVFSLMARVALASALVGFALIYQAGWVSGGGISCEVSWKTPGTSGNWNTATNWAGDQLPTATDNACLPTSATAYTVAVENSAVADGVVVNPGATLQVKATGGVATLTTSGSLFNDGGAVVIGQAPLHSVATISVGGTFNNNGSFSTANSSNHLDANVVNPATGTFTVALGSNLTNGKSNATFANSGTMTVDGQFDILTNSSFTMNVGSSLSGSSMLHVVGGTVDHLGGSVTASTALENVLLKPESTSGIGTLRVVKGSNFLQTDVSANDTVVVEGGFAGFDGVLNSSASRINDGTIKLSSSSLSGTLRTAKLVFNSAVSLTNNGTIQTIQGTGVNTTPAREISGNVVNNGTIRIDYPAVYFGSAALTQNSGSTVLTSNLDITNSGVNIFDLNGGMFSGTGSLSGNLQNDGGTVAPGESPGVLTVQGNFTQGAGGTLAIELSGLNPGSENDRFHVAFVANLGGTLALSRLNGFSPSLSFNYDYFLYDLGAVGNFSAITGTNAGIGKTFVNTLQSGKATLTVVGGSITRKPDGKIALGAVSNPYAGDNIYNLDGTNQSKSKNLVRLRSASPSSASGERPT
jgi:hypothetical protein